MINFTSKAATIVLGLGLSLGPSVAQADTVAALEARIAKLEAEAAKKGQVHTETGVDLTFYGYARLDMYRDFDYDLGPNSGGFAKVNTFTPRDTDYGAHAYQTRLGVRGVLGDVKMRLEGDFYGSGGGNFRLRQAYGEYGGFLLGQANSNWNAAYNPLNVLDFTGPAGSGADYRSPQIRYTYTSSDQMAVSVSLEDDTTNYNKRPVATAALTYGAQAFALNGALASRDIKDDQGKGVSGWGASLSMEAKPWTGGAVTAAIIKGAGISSLLHFGGGVGQQASAIMPRDLAPPDFDTYDISANGNAVGLKGASVGVSQNLSSNVDLSLAYGFYDYDTFMGSEPYSLHKLGTGFFTVTYTPRENILLGLEYMHLQKKFINTSSLSADRLLAVAKFSF